MKVGFVGLGIMGKGMVKNLITKLGVELVVWNRGVNVCEEISNAYLGKITIASTPAEVVQACEVTFSMLSTIRASEEVFDSPSGVIAGVTEGKIIVDCATLSPERMMEINLQILAKGGRFLEAPVSGSKVPAETGTLIFLCGGDDDVYAHPTVSAGFDAMGKAKFLHGSVGSGSRVKLVVNMIMGTMMGAFVEGMQLTEAAGLSQEQMLQVLDLGACANPMFKMKGPKFAANDYAPHFPLKHAQKDMKLALDLAAQCGLQLPTTATANSLYESVLETRGDEDFSSVYNAVQKQKN